MQLGGVRSTSHVANNFIGTGLKEDATPEAADPNIFWPPIPPGLEVGPPELAMAVEAAAGVVTTPVIVVGFKAEPPELELHGGRNPLLTKLAIQKTIT